MTWNEMFKVQCPKTGKQEWANGVQPSQGQKATDGCCVKCGEKHPR